MQYTDHSTNGKEINRRVFSSGGELFVGAAQALHERLDNGRRKSSAVRNRWYRPRQGDSLWQPFSVRLSQNDEGALRTDPPYLPDGHVEQSADAVAFDEQGHFRLLGRLDCIVSLSCQRISFSSRPAQPLPLIR